MIRRLNEVAPEEIALDMQVVLDQWEDQLDQVGGAASDPVGVLAALLLDGLMAAPSYTVVDGWAEENCGQPVFALAGAQVPPPCPWMATSDRIDPLSPDFSISEFSEWLEVVARNVPPANEHADVIGSEIAAMAPEPATGVEALLRSTWSNDLRPALERLDREVSSFCEVSQFVDASELDNLGPQISADGSILQPYDFFGLGSECGDGRLTSGLVVVAFCGGEIVTIGLTDGVPARQPISTDGSDLAIVSRHVAWVEKATRPAEGLGLESFSLTVAIMDLTSGTVNRTQIYEGEDDRDGFVQSVDDQTFAANLTYQDRVIGLNLDGSTRYDLPWRVDWESRRGDLAEVGSGDSINGEHGLLVLSTGEIIEGYRSIISASVCADRFVTRANDGYRIVNLDDGAVTLGPPLEDREYASSATLIVQRDLFIASKDDNIIGVRSDGVEIWNIPEDVVSSIAVVGEWIIVENQSGELVVVDALFGTETTLTGKPADLGVGFMFELEDVWYQPGWDKGLFFDVSTAMFIDVRDPSVQIPYGELCA